MCGDDYWEVVDNDGFVYKRPKRLRPYPPSTSSASADPKAEEKTQKKRKMNTLFKLKQRYKREIYQWELLSNTSKALMEKIEKSQKRLGEEASTSVSEVGSGLGRERLADSAYRRRIDELAIRVQADHDIIRVISDLCDTAEAIYNAQEQSLKEYLHLPICASPREMMAVLCDTHSQSDNEEGDPWLG